MEELEKEWKEFGQSLLTDLTGQRTLITQNRNNIKIMQNQI